jgi:hypothetical protein
MTTYRKSMSEALNQVYLGEDNMALLKKAAGGAMQTLKMKDGKVKMDSFTASAIMQVYKAINPKNKKTMENVVNTGTISALQKLQSLAMRAIKSGDEVEHDGEELDEDGHTDVASAIRKCMTVTEDAQDINSKLQTMSTEDSLPSWWTNKLAVASNDMNKMRDYIVNPVQEEVELDEAKYDLYHKDFSSAMQHSYKMAKKLHGITVDPKEIDDKVASGPRKPSEGKTNSYRLKGDKGAIQVQVYNKGGSKPFELNMYKEEVDLDENKGLENKSKKSGVSVGILKKVYSRGLAAYKTGHRPGTTAPQWAMARVNSFLTGGGARKADADLWKQAKGQKEEVELDEAPAKVWHLANKKFNLISDKGGYILVKQGSGEEKRLKAKTPADATAELVKKGYREEVELGEGTILVADPKTQKVIKIDEKDWPKYEKKGYVQAEGNELDEASARADAKRAMRKDRGVDPADVDSSATDDDVKAASKNIIMQLRKSVSLRGNFPVEFMDKKKVKVDAKIASAVQDKYNSMRKADDKEKFQAKIAKSYKDMLSALKESIAEGGYVGRKDPMPAGKELAKLMKKKGKKKKESTILDRIDQKVQERKNG